MRSFDDYFYEGGSVLVNKFGTRNGILLEEAVNEVVSTRSAEIRTCTGYPAAFDAEYLKYVHRHLFQDCYGWAGEYRECPMGRNVDFCPPERIPDRMAEWSAGFRKDFMMASGSAGDMAGRLVTHWGALNRIHPFRDGNGRSQAAFFMQACRAKGLELDFSSKDIRNLRVARDEASDGRPALLSGILGRSLSGEAVPYGLPVKISAVDRLKAMLRGKGAARGADGPDGPEL